MRGGRLHPGVAAKRDSTCPLCKGDIHKGDRVGFQAGEPAHCECVMAGPSDAA